MEKIKYLVSGDCTVCVEFGNEISPEINRRIRAFKIALEKEAVDGVVETIPTYRSLSVVYRPEVIRFGELTKKFDAVLETMDSIQIPPPSVIEIPVLYGGDMGPDLEFVAAHNHKTPEEVVRIHTSGEYLIYMLGFIAGFPYLGGMSREIAAPRLKSPRVKIEGGSVGIAGEQTGILSGGVSRWLAADRTDTSEALRCRTGKAGTPGGRPVYKIPRSGRGGVRSHRKAGGGRHVPVCGLP